jgi:hypothetical protein
MSESELAYRIRGRFDDVEEAASVAQNETDLQLVQQAIDYIIFVSDEDLFEVLDMHNLTCVGRKPKGFGDEAWAWNEETGDVLLLCDECIPGDTVQLRSYEYVEG